jgi:hypothetical protein
VPHSGLETAPTGASCAWAPGTAAARPATTTVVGPRPGFVHGKPPALQILAVQLGYGRFGCGLGRHLDKPETARFSAEPVLDHVNGCNLPEGLESASQIVLGHISGQIANEDLHSVFL